MVLPTFTKVMGLRVLGLLPASPPVRSQIFRLLFSHAGLVTFHQNIVEDAIYKYSSFEVFTAMSLRTPVPWEIKLLLWISTSRRFEGTFRLHIDKASSCK
jgi:hypothetical protein